MVEKAGKCAVFWDNSNIYIPAQEVAAEKEGPAFSHDLRIHFENLLQLARCGREVIAGVCVGSQPPELQDVWDKLKATGVDLELYERGRDSGKEQAVDQALQVHMLRALTDYEPGVAVLLTGDGAGFHKGKGFHADLMRMHNRGWGIEVMSWDRACHRELKRWAQDVGQFVPLDDHYGSITYVKGIRPQTKNRRRNLAHARLC